VNVKENVRKERKTVRGNGDRRSDRYPTFLHRAIRIEDIAKGNAQIFHEIFRGLQIEKY